MRMGCGKCCEGVENVARVWKVAACVGVEMCGGGEKR